jgi:hypothetical protein
MINQATRLQDAQDLTVCVAEGQPVNGNSYWARINTDGQTGFVPRDAVHIPLDTPLCR